jgi:pimeloyl-ACP methyl ester carboxylesterase
MAALLHRAVDALAMWIPDRRSRPPAPFRPAPAAPLACFGPLPALPPAPPRAGAWRAPSPRACPGDERMEVRARPAVGEPRGVAVLVPPWKVPGLLAVAGYARLAARAGWDVWTVVPPRHLGRAARGARSGDGFVSADLPEVRAAFEQLVLELRVLVALAARRGGETALVGLSLGALAAALAATAPEPVDRVALLAPPADLAAVLAETRIGRRLRELALRAGAPIPGAAPLAEMLLPFRPDRRAPTAGKILLALGSEDRIALPDGALALARAWGIEPRRYRRGHITLLYACRALRRDLARFLSAPGR